MSDKKNVDSFLKKSFEDFSPDVPDHIWENIVKERKKKRFIPFWFNNKKFVISLSAILLALCTAGVLLYNNNASSLTINKKQNIAENSLPERKVAVQNGDNVQRSKLQPSSLNESSQSSLTVKQNNTTADKRSTEGNVSTPIPFNKNKQPATLANKPPISNSTNNKNFSTTNEKSDNNIKEKLGANSTNRDEKYSSVNNNNDFINNYSSNTIKRKTRSTKKSFTKTTSINAETEEEPIEVNSDISLQPIAVLMISKYSSLLVRNQLPVLMPIKIPGCPTVEKNAAANKSYIEAYFGPDYALKKYTDTPNSVLLEKRKATMSTMFAYSAGLRYTKVFNNGMSIRAGINYTQVTERFSFLKDNVVQMVYVISPSGDTTDRYNVRGTRYQTSYNYYRSIDLPLTIGYELGNDRFHANINTGVIANIYSWQNGTTLDDKYNPVSITTGKSETPYQYKTNVGLAFTVAASLYYKLNDKFHLMAEPYLRYSFSPISKESSLLQEKFTIIGLRLGVRMDLH